MTKAGEKSRVVHQERAPVSGEREAPVGNCSGMPAKLPFTASKLALQWKMITGRQTGILVHRRKKILIII
jgi:hypothetical protein